MFTSNPIRDLRDYTMSHDNLEKNKKQKTKKIILDIKLSSRVTHYN